MSRRYIKMMTIVSGPPPKCDVLKWEVSHLPFAFLWIIIPNYKHHRDGNCRILPVSVKKMLN